MPHPLISEAMVEKATKAACIITDCSSEEIRAALEAVADAIVPASKWQDISTAPKDGRAVLTWDGRRVRVADWELEDQGWYGLFRIEPTYWQPLPEPPGTAE